MIINDKPHPGPGRDWAQALGQAGNVKDWPTLGAKLHKVRPAVAELTAQFDRVAAIQIGRVHKAVEQTLVERFHRSQARPQRASRLVRPQDGGYFEIAVVVRLA
jgi:hypothetical protein